MPFDAAVPWPSFLDFLLDPSVGPFVFAAFFVVLVIINEVQCLRRSK